MTNNRKQAFGAKRAIAIFGILLLAAIVGGIVFSTRPPGEIPPGKATPTAGGSSFAPGENFNIDVQLSEGQSLPQTMETSPLAEWGALTAQEIAQIASRLPDLPPDSVKQAEFNRPAESLPPPLTGETVKEAFPPLETEPTPGTVEAGPLEVSRFAPEGDVPIAPFISVTFNQAMVPIGTLGDLAAKDVPVIVEPSMPGTWRWLGTKTLTFQYDSTRMDRLPMATEYRLTVPAGTKSASGAALAEAVTWTFRTPPPKVVRTYPGDSPQPLEPIFFVEFDQRIDPAAVLKTIKVLVGTKKMEVVLASESEIEKDERVSQLVKFAEEGRWIAFRATKPFPPETRILVSVERGTPSAEGPLTTPIAQAFHFPTYSPLRIEEHRCSWYDGRCPPMESFTIEFNNQLDTDAFREDMVTVQPEIPGLFVNAHWNSIEIRGQTKGQTTYTVTISGKIRDIFGQTLGADQRLTFKVDKSDPMLIGPRQTLLTLDPAAPRPVVSVYAVNYSSIKVKIYAVQPADWPRFMLFLRERNRSEHPPKIPGALVSDQTLALNLPADTLSQVDIDLGPYMEGDFGHFIVVVEPPPGTLEGTDNQWKRDSQTTIVWVQVTHIGLDAQADYSQLVAWATDLGDGSPLPGVSILLDNKNATLTDAEGIARFDDPAGATFLVARKGADSAILPSSTSYWYDWDWSMEPPQDTLRWYVFDDRQMYRPGEEIHVKGWIRKIGGGKTGDVELVGAGLRSVKYQVTDPIGNNLMDGQVDVNSLGGFDFVFTLPQAANLGFAEIQLTAYGNLGELEGIEYSHSFQIQEFRRPEFEVTAHSKTEGPYFAGGHASLAVDAKYYAGGGLPNADVTWSVYTSPGSYSPPNWPDFTFGAWRPWWRYYEEDNDTQVATFTSMTDANGTHFLRLDFNAQGDPGKDPGPRSVVAEARVMDVNRQEWASATALLVHPSNLYVGLRSERYFVGRGAPLKIEFIVTDLDGNPVGDRPVTITAARLDWKFSKGEWTEKETDVQTCDVLSGPKPGACTFETPIGGRYQVTAIVTDELGRKNQTRFMRWVSGGEQPPSRKVEQEEVTLIPDRQTYQPGETAQILVQSPFSPAEGLLTVSRSGILYTQRFRIEDGTITLDIPIKEEYLPNLYIQVDLTGSAPRADDLGETLADAPPRPAFATGRLNLSIPPLGRTLAVEATLDQKSLEPGGETTLTVTVKDANGQPVPDAELAVVIVDEAILALTDYTLADPITVFYEERSAYFTSAYGRASLVLADPQALIADTHERMNSGWFFADSVAPGDYSVVVPAAEMEETADGQPAITVRENFNPLAHFSPAARTGSNGEARVLVKLPDNLTRYRIMVVAVDSGGKQFGTAESNLTARLPLMVRPFAPRFLNFGDQFELPVIIQNQTDQPMTVDVIARAANLELEITGKRVTVPANDRVEVRFPAATVMAGTAQIQIAAVSGKYTDAATVELPVYTPATSESFATYGVIDEGALAQPVQYPSGVFPQYGGLEINTSSTALQSLTDAVLYLVAYPYECSEQLASRILAVAGLRDVLAAFEAEGLPSPGEMESAVSRDLNRLAGMQSSIGGFPYWRHGDDSVPFNTIHVTHALVRAEQKGFDVPSGMKLNALGYLRTIESRYPSWYSQHTKWTLSAYALYVRNLAGDRDAAKAERLLKTAGLENLSMEAIGWLWPVIGDPAQLEEIRAFVNNRVVETAGAANFTTAYNDQAYLLLSSNRRTDAILLDALIEDNPQSDLIPKLVNGLLAHRVKGRWGNTQENIFVLLALDRYFNTYETQTPDFVARIWLGDTYAGSSEFRGRTTERHQTFIPMAFVLSETSAGGGTENLILSKDGPGRLYYRLGLRYAPTDLELDPLDMGFVVLRTYEAVDDPEDVTRDSEGVWHIKAGARVRVKITMVADNRRYHVALVDPLPAGLEIVNPALEVSGGVPDVFSSDYRYGWWWWRTWYEHQNLRDDRAEAFTSLLWDGVYEYSYVARAATPGRFIVPPAKAEEMYSPEVFGRSGSDWVIVK